MRGWRDHHLRFRLHLSFLRETFKPITGKNTSSYCLAPPHLSSYHHARTQADPSPRKDTSQHYLAPPPSLAIVSPRPSTSPNGAIIPTHRRRRTTHPSRRNASRHRLAPPQLSSYRHAYLYADRSPRQNISQRCSTTSRRIQHGGQSRKCCVWFGRFPPAAAHAVIGAPRDFWLRKSMRCRLSMQQMRGGLDAILRLQLAGCRHGNIWTWSCSS
jgi:hypothetical protein